MKQVLGKTYIKYNSKKEKCRQRNRVPPSTEDKRMKDLGHQTTDEFHVFTQLGGDNLGWKNGLASIAEFVTCFVLYFWLTVAIHEFLHLSVLRWLGGDGHIILTGYGGAMVYDKTSSNPYSSLLVGLAGGVGVALIYGLLALWNWKDADFEEWAALIPISAMQLGYGIYEAVFLNVLSFETYLKYAWIPSLVGFVVVAVPAFWILVNQIYVRFSAPDE
jgi:hypothetical protein